MANGILWYGERGLVNALVVELSGRGDAGAAAGVRQLLGAVAWLGLEDGSPAWIAEVGRVTFLVEVGMAQFGNPDLILVCETGATRRVVLAEAKVVPYLASAMSNAEGMATSGYNSSINGQLALIQNPAEGVRSLTG